MFLLLDSFSLCLYISFFSLRYFESSRVTFLEACFGFILSFESLTSSFFIISLFNSSSSSTSSSISSFISSKEDVSLSNKIISSSVSKSSSLFTFIFKELHIFIIWSTVRLTSFAYSNTLIIIIKPPFLFYYFF